MSMRFRTFIGAAFALFLFSTVAVSQQRAIIRYNPQAPLTANPRSEQEQTRLLAMLDEDDPIRRNRMIDDLFADYPTSEYMHLFLQARWEIRLGREEDPQAIVDSALDGLDAYQYFMESKLGFIDEPASVREYPTAQYRFASQELRYHQSLVEAYVELGQIEEVAQYTDLGLEAAGATQRWYGELGDEAEDVAGSPADEFAGQTLNSKMFLLDTLRAQYEGTGNVTGSIATSERMLEVLPDDVQLLLSTSLAMVGQIPDDETARQGQMERARTYTERAVEGIDDFLLRADLAQEQQAGVLAQLYATMGMANAQLGDWATAILAYEAAVDATPMAPNLHYMLGFAGANSQNIDVALPAFARAHFLAPDIPDIRAALEQLYQVKEGSLDGLDEYVQSEGATLGN